MPEPVSPRHVVEALMQRISDQSWEGLDDFYAEDAVVEYPFALPVPMAEATGQLTRLVERMAGRAQPSQSPI